MDKQFKVKPYCRKSLKIKSVKGNKRSHAKTLKNKKTKKGKPRMRNGKSKYRYKKHKKRSKKKKKSKKRRMKKARKKRKKSRYKIKVRNKDGLRTILL